MNLTDGELGDWIVDKGAPRPDLVFDACLLDYRYVSDMGYECPLRETRSYNQYMTGCYAFIDEGEIHEHPEVMYIGKAARLRNRVTHHFLHSEFMIEWSKYRSESEKSFLPYIVIWLTDDRASLESKLIKLFSPRYNRRME